MDTVTLNNGISMPQLGLGVYKVTSGDTFDTVTAALHSGYRSIDTAQYYDNEEEVGRALKASGIPREELFITTKVWNSHHGHDRTIEAFETSLKKLGLDYIDLYLIHWPVPEQNKFVETYQTLEAFYHAKKVRAIGVSNFHVHHLEQLMQECEVTPVVNQVECHPYLPQKELKAFCKKHNIFIECWSPLYRGGELLEEPVIRELADKYEKTPAQIVLRWHLQEDSIVIPKSVTPSRIKENIDVFGFQLTDSQMDNILQLDSGSRIGKNPDDMNKTD